jgi:hypothetical protein
MGRKNLGLEHRRIYRKKWYAKNRRRILAKLKTRASRLNRRATEKAWRKKNRARLVARLAERRRAETPEQKARRLAQNRASYRRRMEAKKAVLVKSPW